MATLADLAILAIFAVIFLQLSRPSAPDTRDLQVWTDDAERRMLHDLPPRNYR